MNSKLYKLVYCSRNRIRGNKAEITAELQSILVSARANNTQAGVTGALLYNAGNFAQVLEGPLHSVEHIFEAIQRDPRHSEVIVVQSGPAVEREFPEWSMAFAGNSATERMPLATAAFGAGEQMLTILKDLLVCEDDWVLLDAA
jgi:blue light- and temperature-responsive anti-repressor